MQNENKAYPMSRLLEALQLEQTLEQRVEAYMISQKEFWEKLSISVKIKIHVHTSQVEMAMILKG